MTYLSPNLSATLNKRRPKHILHDPDDQITTDNAPFQNIQSTSAQRLRRRRRGPRLLTSTGLGLAPRSRKRADYSPSVTLSLQSSPEPRFGSFLPPSGRRSLSFFEP
ncbi:jg7619 [Pararge aegeria aegeria]|uniref:Jg7619 protein n=1 Tax=Pararge aegeria aegeria TaxID=348720 RepID=A0A8S4REP6_9NEOP|nr:jg7619 [Pararge aegeria aegeria]